MSGGGWGRVGGGDLVRHLREGRGVALVHSAVWAPPFEVEWRPALFLGASKSIISWLVCPDQKSLAAVGAPPFEVERRPALLFGARVVCEFFKINEFYGEFVKIKSHWPPLWRHALNVNGAQPWFGERA